MINMWNSILEELNKFFMYAIFYLNMTVIKKRKKKITLREKEVKSTKIAYLWICHVEKWSSLIITRGPIHFKWKSPRMRKNWYFNTRKKFYPVIQLTRLGPHVTLESPYSSQSSPVPNNAVWNPNKEIQTGISSFTVLTIYGR